MRNTEIQTRGLDEIHDRPVGGGSKHRNTEIQKYKQEAYMKYMI